MFLSEKRNIQIVKCESESYSDEEIEGLTAKAFGGDFDLVQTNWSFSEDCEHILQTPRGPANVGFRPRMPRGADLRPGF